MTGAATTSPSDARAPETSRQADNPDTFRAALRTFFEYPSPRILIATVAGAWAIRIGLGDWSTWDAVIMAATVALWPVQEWIIHVFILHFRPREVFGRKIDLLAAREHRKHHRDPWNIPLVFIPTPIFYWAIPVEVALWNLLMPTTALAFTVIAFYFTMSLHYEWVHFIVHTRYQPSFWYYRRLWRNHRLHHCKSEKFWYGVTMLEGDWLLGTQPDQRNVALSPTCRTLGYQDNLGVPPA